MHDLLVVDLSLHVVYLRLEQVAGCRAANPIKYTPINRLSPMRKPGIATIIESISSFLLPSVARQNSLQLSLLG
jgi:hypothetical protein